MVMNGEIYIVDDSPDQHFLLYQILKQLPESYSVKFFEDGKILHRHLGTLSIQEQHDKFPKLIILDLHMPGMSGLQLLKLIKKPAVESHEHLKDIPVVVMSSDTREDRIIKCYQEGADAYIIKPMEFDKVKSTMQSICRFWLGREVQPAE
ncbi:response regulator [Dyadobacter flavalbus]|uniref:Response regulator n=2 Tax=Dyadobacter flavalbus TaxID=2579942 RepID=A0A5M8QU67_9BACT|nr:response regulator [Dyadobacter flavalbus]